MKYAILLGDGMADYPLKDFGGKTPLESGRTPNMDRIAEVGAGGLSSNVPKGMTPESGVANLSVLGFNPADFYEGRGPIEAKSMGVELVDDEIAFRCNFVTIAEDKMMDYSAGHIPSSESSILIEVLNKGLENEGVRFYAGVSYRNLMIVKEDLLSKGRGKLKCTPPHNITGKKIKRYLPKGKGGLKLKEIMRKSIDILIAHEINQVKLDLHENPVNMIWLWGGGKKLKLPDFKDAFGVNAGIISAVDLIKGIGRCLNMKVIDVPGATGYYDTDYNAKADFAVEALNDLDFIYVHVEAPDEAGHNGDLRNKVLAIERFDEMIVGKVFNWLEQQGDYRIMVLPDHPTPIKLRTHVSDPVPFVICGKGIQKDSMSKFTEKEAFKGSYGKVVGHDLMKMFVQL